MSNNFNTAYAAKMKRNANRLALSQARKAARPLLRGQYAAARVGRAANIGALAPIYMGGSAATQWGREHPNRAASRALLAMGAHANEFAKRSFARSTARERASEAVNRLLAKPVMNWNNNDKASYKVHRQRYMNSVNQTASGRLRGMARVRAFGRLKSANLRNKLGFAGLKARGALSLGRYAGNLAASAAARGYGAFTRGVGKVAGYGYRAGHALGNYPRAAYTAQRAPTVAAVKSAVRRFNNAALTAAANPTRTNVRAANAAGTRMNGLLKQVNNQL
jgi:hypothetical protein